MTQLNDLAYHLLRFEQQLTAYQKLHADELAELWRTLDECKGALVTALPPPLLGKYFNNPLVAKPAIKEEEE